jgi:polysaccharide biosynthesis/export protein
VNPPFAVEVLLTMRCARQMAMLPSQTRVLSCSYLLFFAWAAGLSVWASPLDAQTINGSQSEHQAPAITQLTGDTGAQTRRTLETSGDWNHRLHELAGSSPEAPLSSTQEYRIGPEDVLDINVFAAPELNRQVRVSAGGEVSLPLLGETRAAGLTPREFEVVLQELLHRKYMKDPHVSVFVAEMQSHPVSVLGAVKRPGVFQVREAKTLLEVLSLAEGLSDDAGETVIIMRGAGLSGESGSLRESPPAATEFSASTSSTGAWGEPVLGAHQGVQPSPNVIEANLKDLLDAPDPICNPMVYPGDIVKVTRAGIVYVVGEVQKPGGFTLKSNERISVLEAIALSEGLKGTAAKSSARLIRTDQHTGERKETPIDLGKIMNGKSPDPMLEPKDIVFVPNSAAKATWSRGVEGAAQTLTGLLIFHW